MEENITPDLLFRGKIIERWDWLFEFGKTFKLGVNQAK
jgi:hypothetical protein